MSFFDELEKVVGSVEGEAGAAAPGTDPAAVPGGAAGAAGGYGGILAAAEAAMAGMGQQPGQVASSSMPAGVTPATSAALVQEAMTMLTSGGAGGAGGAGGMSGLVQQFEQQGLGHLVGSWIGGGQNLPISGQQLQGVLGEQQVQELAQRVGLPPGLAASALAVVLPAVVDKLTPNGTVEHQLLQQGLSWLAGRA
jgi:uncharacterized protein YidB (DUF937 family)